MIDLAEFAKALTNPVAQIQALAVLVDLLPEDDNRRSTVRNDLAAALAQCSEELFSSEADVIRYGFSRVNVDKSAKLASVALMILSTLYESERDVTGSEATPDIVEGLQTLAKEQRVLAEKIGNSAADRGDNDAYKNVQILSDIAGAILVRTKSTGDILKLAYDLRSILGQSSSAELPASMAACKATWWLTQGITGSLMAATLGGLAPYREPWELMSAFETMA